MRINYDLFERILKAKEHIEIDQPIKPNPNLNETGGIKEIPKPIHVSNLAIYNPSTGKPDKIGFMFVENNGQQKKIRFFKSNQEPVNQV